MKKYVRKEANENIFEKYDNTDLNGSGVETAIDSIIEEYTTLIKKQIDKVDQNIMRQAVKKLWLSKIKEWNKL